MLHGKLYHCIVVMQLPRRMPLPRLPIYVLYSDSRVSLEEAGLKRNIITSGNVGIRQQLTGAARVTLEGFSPQQYSPIELIQKPLSDRVSPWSRHPITSFLRDSFRGLRSL